MARRGPRANLREQAIGLLAGGDALSEVARAVGIVEADLREWQKKRAFAKAVQAGADQALEVAWPAVQRRIIEQAEAGQSSQQKMLIEYRLKLKELEAQNSSERWVVQFGTAAPPATKPEEPSPDKDLGE